MTWAHGRSNETSRPRASVVDNPRARLTAPRVGARLPVRRRKGVRHGRAAPGACSPRVPRVPPQLAPRLSPCLCGSLTPSAAAQIHGAAQHVSTWSVFVFTTLVACVTGCVAHAVANCVCQQDKVPCAMRSHAPCRPPAPSQPGRGAVLFPGAPELRVGGGGERTGLRRHACRLLRPHPRSAHTRGGLPHSLTHPAPVP